MRSILECRPVQGLRFTNAQWRRPGPGKLGKLLRGLDFGFLSTAADPAFDAAATAPFYDLYSPAPEDV
jgi:hypothetical protein